MPDYLLWITAAGTALLAIILVLLAVALGRLRALGDSTRAAGAIVTELAVLKAQGQDTERDLKSTLASLRGEQSEASRSLRGEVAQGLHRFTDATQGELREFDARLSRFTQLTHDQLKQATDRLDLLRQDNDRRLEAVRSTLEQRLDVLRTENTAQLEQMRVTVDDKLQQTLESRLGHSFKLVSDQLDQVHKGLGEMQTLAQGVGDLKRVLTNVKSRGSWGEMQLGALLGDLFTPDQYGINVETVPGSDRRVEYAIRVPSRPGEPPCWIPVDSKFPVEEWERLQAALDRADVEGAEAARKALAQFARTQARKVRDTYIRPPHTSEYAFVFLPTESLYAELMSRPGLCDELQREYRVTLAGPSNFVAFLNVVQMGFQRLAIEQRSAEVWQLLAAVRGEFGKFGDMLTRAQKKLQEASNTLDDARGKTVTIARKLRNVETLPAAEAARLLAAPAPFVLEPDDPAFDEK